MEIILFFVLLGASVLLGVCFGIVNLPIKAHHQAGFTSYNRLEKVLMKIHRPTLKIFASLLFVLIFGLCWQQAKVEYMPGHVVLTIIYLCIACLWALLAYVCCHPYCLTKKSLLFRGTWRKNKIVHLILSISYVAISIIGIVFFLVKENQVDFMLLLSTFLIVLVGYILFFCLRGMWSVLLYLGDLCAGLCQAYWKWVLKH